MIRRLAIAALCALGCARAPAPPAGGGPPAARLRGLDFSAELEVTPPSPTKLDGSVRVTNRSATPETLVFADGCPVRLRVYEVRGTRNAPVWEGPAACAGVAEPLTLAISPGESVTLPIPPTTADEILDGGLPPEAYRVTVWLAPEDRVIEIEAGQVELTTSR
ncbi:MAG TPA: hypothetical protein VIE68_07365 [Gemmatimonadota bacterium]|jgi:hypothetical protein